MVACDVHIQALISVPLLIYVAALVLATDHTLPFFIFLLATILHQAERSSHRYQRMC